MKDPSRVRLSGPLREFGPGFVGELERLGYSSLGDAASAVGGSCELLDAGRGADAGGAD